MRIFYDHQILTYQKVGGVSRYFCEIMKRMPKNQWFTSTLISNNQYVDEYDLFKHYHFLPDYNFKFKSRLMLEMGIPLTLYHLCKKDFDIYHQTHFEPFSLLGLGNKPMVTTFHDMNFFTCNKNSCLMKSQLKSLQRADAIIAISNNTKNDLIEQLHIDENKIKVIYHGIYKYPRLCKNRIIEQQYILYVGNRYNKFKNFKNLIKAFAILKGKYNDIYLVCVGQQFTKDEIKTFIEYHIDNNIKCIYANDSQLNRLYHDALFFIYPSIYEGFGFPILEAMVNGCPVALANASCFPEIAQDAAIYFSPYNIDDIYNTMDTLISSESQRNELKIKGNERVKAFSWEKSVNQHLKIYESLL